MSSDDCVANHPCVCETVTKVSLIDQLSGKDEFIKDIYSEILLDDDSQTNQSRLIDCSNRSIRIIPKFKLLGYSNQPIVDCLDLSNNQLDFVSESLFYGLILRCIDLSFNSINRMSRNAFKGLLNSLSILKLGNNQITSEIAFPAYFISKLNKLQVLDMSSNRLDKVPEKSFQTMFSSTLRFLDLSNNQIICIMENSFDGAESLTYLNLCHNQLGLTSDHCSKNYVKLSFLRNLKQLENVQLCSNRIDSSSLRENFRFNPRLRILNLANNNLQSLSDGMFCHLKSLNVLNLASNEISRIEIGDFNCLKNLHELYLQSNRLVSIADKSFEKLKNLRMLRLDNNFDLIKTPSMLNGPQHSLEYLSINFVNQKFDDVLDYLISENGLVNLDHLDLSFSSLSFKMTLNLADLLLTKNRINRIVCRNCSITTVVYKFDNFNNSNELETRYKHYGCDRELNNRSVMIDLISNRLENCQEPAKSVDLCSNVQISSCSKCSNVQDDDMFKLNSLVQQRLVRLLDIKNDRCQPFNTELIDCNATRKIFDCKSYYKKESSGEWKLASFATTINRHHINIFVTWLIYFVIF